MQTLLNRLRRYPAVETLTGLMGIVVCLWMALDFASARDYAPASAWAVAAFAWCGWIAYAAQPWQGGSSHGR